MTVSTSAAPWPAFKEWAAVVAALGAGAQTLILRKGGISEGRGGFDPGHALHFWLFPTAFHAQREKRRHQGLSARRGSEASGSSGSCAPGRMQPAF